MLIVGIEPKPPGLNVFSGSHQPRLGLPLLFTMARELGHQVRIYCEEIASVDWREVSQADVICISSTTSTIPRAYDFIRKIRAELNARVPILIGGPHVTFLPDEALTHGADYVFLHEGDVSFIQWLNWWIGSRDPQELFRIFDLAFRVGNQYFRTQPSGPRQWVDLDTLPTPDLDLIVGYGTPRMIPLITSRGCPKNCDFCSEHAMFGHQYRFRSPARVIEDLEYYDRRYGKVPVFIADDNFGASLSRLDELCDSIIDRGLVRHLSAQVCLELAEHPDALQKMRDAGVTRVFIGYESVNQLTLDAMGKHLQSADMKRLTRALHRFGIAIHSMWVHGNDDDTIETVKETVRCCIRWGIETTQFLILVPIPGSRLYDRFVQEGRIIIQDWSKYDGHHVVFKPKRMTPLQLEIAVMFDAMPKAYNRWQTYKLLVQNNARIAWGMVTGRAKHPLMNLKANLITFIARLNGRRNIQRIHPQLAQFTQYLKRLV